MRILIVIKHKSKLLISNKSISVNQIVVPY